MRHETCGRLTAVTDQLELVLARDPRERRAVGELRYRVYCEERGWEPAWRFPDGVESDRFDSRAHQLLLRDRRTAAAVGCVRLILCDPVDPAEPFPFEERAGDRLYPAGDFLRRSRASFGEVSRFTVAPEYRAHRGELGVPVALVLGVSAAALVAELGLTQCVAFGTPVTMRLLASFGLPFRQVGDRVPGHGGRAPFAATVDDLLTGRPTPASTLLDAARTSLRSQVPSVVAVSTA